MAKKIHPVSEAQRKWAFAAEDRGELPKGKAEKWSKRAEGKDLPAKTASLTSIRQAAFEHEFTKVAGKMPEALKAYWAKKNGAKGAKAEKKPEAIEQIKKAAFEEELKKLGMSAQTMKNAVGEAKEMVHVAPDMKSLLKYQKNMVNI